MKHFYIIFMFIFISMGCSEHPMDLRRSFFRDTAQNTLFSHFMDSALTISQAHGDSLMFMVLFSKSGEDTLVTFCSVPYPNRIVIGDPDQQFTIYYTVLFRGYLVSIYDFSKENISSSLTCAASKNHSTKSFNYIFDDSCGPKLLKGMICPFVVQNGQFVHLSKEDGDDSWEDEPTIEDNLFSP